MHASHASAAVYLRSQIDNASSTLQKRRLLALFGRIPSGSAALEALGLPADTEGGVNAALNSGGPPGHGSFVWQVAGTSENTC